MRPKTKYFFGYVGLLIAGLLVFAAVQLIGHGLEPITSTDVPGELQSTAAVEVPLMFHILLTLLVVVVFGALFGRLCMCIGQPPVIGEVLAGIALGPSVLGMFSPSFLNLLIPTASSDPAGLVNASLKAISQLGIVLYMFMVGLELDVGKLKSRAGTALAISHSSIVVPFSLGSILAISLYPRF